MTDRSSPPLDDKLKLRAGRLVSVALTQEGERNQAQLVDASKQRVDELRALMRKQKRVKKWRRD
ncbi:hypothetical protein AB4Z10_15770 [Bosea sp. RAF48]|uniref:hypothetical protein n=1 Tax=Bosea sp. RAF48 TaxID=3237480 RepID=UPI003F9134F1